MTEKALHKLKRQEVLQLLLVQVQEAEQLQKKLEETTERLREEEELCGRLKARLNSKDAQIHKLKGRLDKKDEQVHNLKMHVIELQKERLKGLEEAGSIAEVSMELGGVFEAAQKAADIYLENIRQLWVRKAREEL